MKKTTLFLVLLLNFLHVNSQTSNNTSYFRSEPIYLVGNDSMGYKKQLFSCKEKDNVSFNGIKVPAIAYFMKNKHEFIGGKILNENDVETSIKNILLYKKSGIVYFKVVGKDFYRYIEIKDENYFLYFDYKSAIFYSEKYGIWKIFKK